MAPEEESKPEAPQAAVDGPRPPVRRDRRPGRGRRGRGRGARPKPASAQVPEAPEREPDTMASPEEAEPIFELADPTAHPTELPDATTQEAPPEQAHREPEPLARQYAPESSQPASPLTVEKAIEEVGAVVDSLRTALEEMEEVLEMLEMFERQKNADEREIESLRRAVRQVHRPRDAGHHHHR